MKNKLFSLLFIATLLLSITLSCQKKRVATPMDLAKTNLIPRPASLNATGSSFLLEATSEIYYTEQNESLNAILQQFAKDLRPATGYELLVTAVNESPKSGIYAQITAYDSIIGDEGYKLKITEDLINLQANKPEGIYRGLQTIKQLLPAAMESSELQGTTWEVPTGEIIDYPNYQYRGTMLDVSRHFFGVNDVKQFIDYIAAYKMNVLHLHLSDDQGWRIEIKSWPNLTEHGGQTEVGGTEGGFYTQEDYKEIVNYAAERFITIIPEIDMPGHTNAALASYPELNCDNKARELYTGTEVGFSSLCTDKEITYTFINDVVKEIAAITPGPYFHIGGDESHATKPKDYIYFIERVQKIVDSHGKRMIGWADIANAPLNSSSIAQFWQKKQDNALKALEQDVQIIISPANKAYLDMKYNSSSPLGLHWAGYVPVDVAYNWYPEETVKGISKKDILGIEAPLWTETIKNMSDIQYMVFPRLPGYAEIGWTPGTLRDWDDYKVRLANQKERFNVLKINYYQSKVIPWPKDSIK